MKVRAGEVRRHLVGRLQLKCCRLPLAQPSVTGVAQVTLQSYLCCTSKRTSNTIVLIVLHP